MTRIIFLIQHPDLPSCRYRALQFIPALEREGIRCESATLPKGILARRKLFRRLPEFDVVFLQKKNFYPWSMMGLRKRVRSLIYDIDDAVMLNDSSRKKFRSRKKEWRFATVARAARIVIVCNRYLAEWAGRYAADVRVIPTVVDLSRYIPPAGGGEQGDKITIGWIGSGSTFPYLAALRPALEEVGRRYKNAQLKLVCDRFLDLDNMPVIKCPWSEETEIRDLFSMDIGLSPAIDDPWFRGKGNLKAVQYLAAGRAVVCSPIGALRDAVADGETGLYARSPGEWVTQIGRLIEDAPLRKRLGDAGRKAVEKEFCVDAVLPQVVKAIQDAAQGG